MVLVLLGTQNNSFERLLKEIENCIDKKIIDEEVIVQAGNTKYKSSKMKVRKFIAHSKIEEYMDEANYIITHGGVGSIIDALKKNKKVIAVPRKQEYKEHVNNHQQQIVDNFNEEGYIIGIQDVEKLKDAVSSIDDFKPKKYVSNTENIINLIIDFIDK